MIDLRSRLNDLASNLWWSWHHDLDRIFRQIDRLERSRVDVVRYVRQDERTTPFLAGALVWVALSGA